MKSESAVDFPGQFRLHVALTVSNLEKSKHFYEVLFGVSPTKVRPRYAKFEPHDPSVNLTLNEVEGEIGVEGVDGFGVLGHEERVLTGIGSHIDDLVHPRQELVHRTPRVSCSVDSGAGGVPAVRSRLLG